MPKQEEQLNQEKHVYYGRNVLHSIIVLAANEISGVIELSAKSVKFDLSNKSLSVTVNLSLKYGHKASDVAYRIQENIKRSIETMTEYHVSTINVNILNVVLDGTD